MGKEEKINELEKQEPPSGHQQTGPEMTQGHLLYFIVLAVLGKS